MLTNFIFTRGKKCVSYSMVHAEIDQGSGLISITLDNGKVYVISENNILKEIHSDTNDIYELIDGSKYCLEYPEFV